MEIELECYWFSGRCSIDSVTKFTLFLLQIKQEERPPLAKSNVKVSLNDFYDDSDKVIEKEQKEYLVKNRGLHNSND